MITISNIKITLYLRVWLTLADHLLHSNELSLPLTSRGCSWLKARVRVRSLVISSSFSPSHTWLLLLCRGCSFRSAVDERPKAGTMSNLCSVALNSLKNKLNRPILTLCEYRDKDVQPRARQLQDGGLISSGCSEPPSRPIGINGRSLLFYTQEYFHNTSLKHLFVCWNVNILTTAKACMFLHAIISLCESAWTHKHQWLKFLSVTLERECEVERTALWDTVSLPVLW